MSDLVLLRLADGSRRPLDPGEAFYLEAEGDDTLVRTRHRRALIDVRPLGELLSLFEPHGFARIHDGWAVNLRRVRVFRPRAEGRGWEAVLEPPVNRVLAVSRRRQPELWARFPDGA